MTDEEREKYIQNLSRSEPNRSDSSQQHTVNCNQCGREVDVKTKVGLAFNMGHGPVYVCIECAPPCSAKETIELFERFIKPQKEVKHNEPEQLDGGCP